MATPETSNTERVISLYSLASSLPKPSDGSTKATNTSSVKKIDRLACDCQLCVMKASAFSRTRPCLFLVLRRPACDLVYAALKVPDPVVET